MGNAIQSNETQQTLSAYTSFVNNLVTNISTTARAQCTSGNNFDLITGGSQDCPFVFSGGSLTVTQLAGTTCTFNSTQVTDLNNTLKDQLTTKTRQFIDQKADNRQGWLATAFSIAVQKGISKEELINRIVNGVTTNLTNRCESVAQSLNNQRVRLCGVYTNATLNFNQSSFVTAYTSCVNENLIKTFVDDQVLQDIAQETDQVLINRQGGLDDIYRYIIIGIVALLAIVLIVGLIFLLRR